MATQKRYIKANFSPQSDDKIKLDDIVFVYTDGLKAKVITLETARYYPVIHDKYYHNTDIVTDVSVIIDPFTLFSIILEGIWYPEINGNKIIVTKNDVKYDPIEDHFHSEDKNIKRYEIRLMTHKNELMQYHDSIYLNVNMDENEQLTELQYYYSDDKQLIYIIEYKSKSGKYKNTIVIPKYNSFDLVKNGMDDYILKYETKIREKAGFILQCYSFACDTKNYKTIKL